MDLNEYLKNSKVTQLQFAKRIGMSLQGFRNILHKKVAISLETALIIHAETKGEVELVELLQDESRKMLNDHMTRFKAQMLLEMEKTLNLFYDSKQISKSSLKKLSQSV